MQLHSGEEFFMHCYSYHLGDFVLENFVESKGRIEKLLWSEGEETLL